MVREARKTRPDLPILFMSGYAEEQLGSRSTSPMSPSSPKPFSVQELAEAVRNALAVANKAFHLAAPAAISGAMCVKRVPS